MEPMMMPASSPLEREGPEEGSPGEEPVPLREGITMMFSRAPWFQTQEEMLKVLRS